MTAREIKSIWPSMWSRSVIIYI